MYQLPLGLVSERGNKGCIGLGTCKGNRVWGCEFGAYYGSRQGLRVEVQLGFGRDFTGYRICFRGFGFSRAR